MNDVTVEDFVKEFAAVLRSLQHGTMDVMAAAAERALADAKYAAAERRRLLTKRSEKGNIT